jgi:hypothetical protein
MKPTDLELAAALAEAEARRDAGDDPAFLAQGLLYLYRRNALLEGVLEHVELFLKFGMPAEEHAKLVRLLEEIEAFDHHETGSDEGRFGL